MRHLPLSEADRRHMLAAIGAGSVDELFRDVPAEALLDAPVDLPNHQGEMAVEQAFTRFALKNLSPGCAPSFIGGGLYRHHVPAAVDHLIQRGEFLTAYTPYQPEIAQGTLQYLFEFQTQVALLTGMEVANASMYDGATACAEALQDEPAKVNADATGGGWFFKIRIADPGELDALMEQAAYKDYVASLS
jgi:glycine dehydrogenase subunit 1